MNTHTAEIMADAADPAPQLPAIKSRIQDIVAALETITRAAETMSAAYDLTCTANSFAAKAHCGRKYWGLDRSGSKSYQALFPDDFDPAESVETYRRQLDAAVWSHLLELTGIREMMDVTASREFDDSLRGDVTPVTMDNLLGHL